MKKNGNPATAAKNGNVSSSNAERFLGITVLEAKGLPSSRPTQNKHFVRVLMGGATRETKPAERGTSPKWREHFDLAMPSDLNSKLSLSVMAKHVLRDGFIGAIEESVSVILASRGQDVTRPLSDRDGQLLKAGGSLTFRVDAAQLPTQSAVEVLVSGPSKDLEAIQRVSVPDAVKTAATGANVVGEVVNLAGSNSACWEPLLNSVKLFTKLADRISEVHPYAKMAWDVLSFAHKMFINQIGRDDSIDSLLDTMKEAYKFVYDANGLSDNASLNNILVAFAIQSTECGYFIQTYARTKSFGKRLVKSAVSNTDDVIAQYKMTFEELYIAFDRKATVQTAISVRRILDDVHSVAIAVDLNDMIYTPARFEVERVCLPHTRQGLLDDIYSWANELVENQPRICLLTGMPGSGKSAISHTVSRQFNELKRLGSSFFFDKDRDETCHPENVFCTIARDLADLDPYIRDQLWKAIGNNRSLRLTRSVKEQFERFILNPTKDMEELGTNGPLVIVIDALDKCGDAASREGIVDILARRISELPSNFRFLVTSTPEVDIISAFSRQPLVIHKKMEEIERTTTDADISTFVHHQFSRDLTDAASQAEQWQDAIVNHSDGLFVWASTASRFVGGTGGEADGKNPVERLNIALSGEQGGEKISKLYLTILRNAFDEKDPLVMARFRVVLGRILVVMTPLSVTSLNELGDSRDPTQNFDVDLITRRLGSLIDGVQSRNTPLRMFHASFREFLVDPLQSYKFYVDVTAESGKLAGPCLGVISKSLHQSLELMQKFLQNQTVSQNSVEQYMSPTVQYACRFWIHHLLDVREPAHDLKSSVRTFTIRYSLLWVEAMNRLGRLKSDWRMIEECWRWFQIFNSGDRNTESSYSLVHSAILSFWLSESQTDFGMNESGLVPQRNKILSGLKGDISNIDYVAYSTNSSKVLTVTNDRYVQIWELETGEPIGHTHERQRDSVSSVAFSPDKQYIMTGYRDGSLRMWDSKNGTCIWTMPNGHTDSITSMAFSADGNRLMSTSVDKSIRFWDVLRFKSHSELLSGHSAASFSLDCKHASSASSDNTIWLWDLEREPLGRRPLEGHTKAVNSTCFSNDGKLLISASDDKTIRIWDTGIGKQISMSKANVAEALSAIFSDDCNLAASKSSEGKVLVFEVPALHVVEEPEGVTILK
ncbi:hypothetical protein BD410DRAFT_796718 [Rickenella mellea]|uniref:C2 domain-containing protein n=1 Tax=Rickenella mellea TaxID=50990 RepID=A0A4Y7PKJ5_9AGAM|nr:hypothetical protein BD410DRAFT_796718 [Rickenella mellea]